MRKITKIIIHCAATPPDVDVGVKEITDWHQQRGFATVGYHYVIRRNGLREVGRPLSQVGAHAKGHNSTSIGVCMVGGCRRDGKKLVAENNFTDAQWDTLLATVSELLKQFPGAEVIGHRDVEKGKECPSFSVRDWGQRVGIMPPRPFR